MKLKFINKMTKSNMTVKQKPKELSKEEKLVKELIKQGHEERDREAIEQLNYKPKFNQAHWNYPDETETVTMSQSGIQRPNKDESYSRLSVTAKTHPKELDWEKDWIKLVKINFDGLDGNAYGVGETEIKVRLIGLCFIQSLLTQQRTELLEGLTELIKLRIKGRQLWLEDGSLAPDFGVIPELRQYNQAIVDVLLIINLLNKKDEK